MGGPNIKITKNNYSKHVSSRFGVRWAHHRHTGNRLPIHCTSYAFLFFLLALTGASILFASMAAKAGPPQSESGQINLGGKVVGAPPSQAAVITNPTNGAKFNKAVITVKGTCQDGLVVEIYRHKIFAGSTICTSQGSFQLKITLIEGANVLLARSKDGENRYAPDSNKVTVYYQPVVTSTGDAAGRPPFLIYTEPVQEGIQLSDQLQLKYEIDGGQAPYATSVDWRDNSQDSLYSHKASGDFVAKHRYYKAGQYTVSISGSDQNGNQAFIQTIAVVQGPSQASGVPVSQAGCTILSTAPGCVLVDPLVELVEAFWPAFILAVLMTLSFWLGERVIYDRFTRIKPRV